MMVYQLYWVVVDIVVPVYILCKKDKITKERKSDQKKEKKKEIEKRKKKMQKKNNFAYIMYEALCILASKILLGGPGGPLDFYL